MKVGRMDIMIYAVPLAQIMIDFERPEKRVFSVRQLPSDGDIRDALRIQRCVWQLYGTEGTHPWSQGFPLTRQLEMFDGPPLPDEVQVTWEDRFYPKAWGHLN